MFSRWTNPQRSADREAVGQGYAAFEAKDWPRAGDLLDAWAAEQPEARSWTNLHPVDLRG